MRLDVVTVFPAYFASPLRAGLLGRAGERGLVQVVTHDLRDFTSDRHRSVDDVPFGGGPGMVMRAQPWFDALDAVRGVRGAGPGRVILLSPDGDRFDQAAAVRLSAESRLVLCCGRYEGIDERVRTRVDESLSVGDYVLAGGETAALVVIDAVARLVPGVMGNPQSAAEESFGAGDGAGVGLLEYPHYTRPSELEGMAVPEVLRSGDHGRIARWRREQALRRTLERRPDLLASASLDARDLAILEGLRSERPGGAIVPPAPEGGASRGAGAA